MSLWIRRSVDILRDLIDRVDPFETALYLTLLIFMLEKTDLHSLVFFCSLGILVRPLIRNPIYWFGLAAVFVIVTWYPWYSPGNHRYLQAYWCLAIAFCFLCSNPQEALARSARWLIVFVFLFALIWKIRTPEFMDGGFLEYSLISDYRFIPVAMLAGLDAEVVLKNAQLLHDYIDVGDLSGSVSLQTTAAVPIIAKFLTGWALLIEAGVCIVFFLTTRRVSQVLRHGVLLIFIVTTYSLAPVVGFGWLFIAMGLVLLPAKEKRAFLPLYILAFVVVFLARNPGIYGAIRHIERFLN